MGSDDSAAAVEFAEDSSANGFVFCAPAWLQQTTARIQIAPLRRELPAIRIIGCYLNCVLDFFLSYRPSSPSRLAQRRAIQVPEESAAARFPCGVSEPQFPKRAWREQRPRRERCRIRRRKFR